jgi:hypothetical protein
MKHLLAITSALLLAACASAPVAPTVAGPAATGPTSIAGATPAPTGTRLPNKGIDRAPRTIGNQAYKEDAHEIRSIGNEVGARSN